LETQPYESNAERPILANRSRVVKPPSPPLPLLLSFLFLFRLKIDFNLFPHPVVVDAADAAAAASSFASNAIVAVAVSAVDAATDTINGPTLSPTSLL
jgi:hypothetical protein